jgi:hypothetical protein
VVHVRRRPSDGNTYYTIETTLGLEGRTLSAAVVVHRRFPEFRQLARRVDKVCPGLPFLSKALEEVADGTKKAKAKTALDMLPPKTRNFTTKSKREAEEFLLRRREGLQAFFDELLAVNTDPEAKTGEDANVNDENVNSANMNSESVKAKKASKAPGKKRKHKGAGVYDIPHLAAFLGLGDKRNPNKSLNESLDPDSSPVRQA